MTIGALLIHGFTATPAVLGFQEEQLKKAGFVTESPLLAGHGDPWDRLADTRWTDWYASVEQGFCRLNETAETIHVAWDLWGIRAGYISQDFVRAWLGGYWSVIGTLLTVGALAVALLIPDTMELADYREGEPHTDWRRKVGALAWRPSVPWLVVLALLFGAVFANLLQFTEFLYYQF